MSYLRVLVLLAFVCVSVAGPAHSSQAQIPTLPHAFLGTVEIAGKPAPVYTQVEGRAKGVLTGIAYNPFITEEAGKYGKPGGFDPKLLVQGPDIADGTPIEFYVNGVKAQCAEPGGVWKDSYPFKAGSVTILNLRVQETAPGLRIFLPLVMRYPAGATAQVRPYGIERIPNQGK